MSTENTPLAPKGISDSLNDYYSKTKIQITITDYNVPLEKIFNKQRKA